MAWYISCDLRGRDVLLSDREEPEDTDTLENKREIPVNRPKEIRESSFQKLGQPTAQLKCLYAYAYGMGNKQAELEIMVQLENYNVSGKEAGTELYSKTMSF